MEYRGWKKNVIGKTTMMAETPTVSIMSQVIAAKRDRNKKLSYRRETARQLPTWRGGG